MNKFGLFDGIAKLFVPSEIPIFCILWLVMGEVEEQGF
jgi:hypothetical protein